MCDVCLCMIVLTTLAKYASWRNVLSFRSSTSVQVLIVPSAHKDAVSIPYFPTGPLYISKECRQRLGNVSSEFSVIFLKNIEKNAH